MYSDVCYVTQEEDNMPLRIRGQYASQFYARKRFGQCSSTLLQNNALWTGYRKYTVLKTLHIVSLYTAQIRAYTLLYPNEDNAPQRYSRDSVLNDMPAIYTALYIAVHLLNLSHHHNSMMQHHILARPQRLPPQRKSSEQSTIQHIRRTLCAH